MAIIAGIGIALLSLPWPSRAAASWNTQRRRWAGPRPLLAITCSASMARRSVTVCLMYVATANLFAGPFIYLILGLRGGRSHHANRAAARVRSNSPDDKVNATIVSCAPRPWPINATALVNLTVYPANARPPKWRHCWKNCW